MFSTVLYVDGLVSTGGYDTNACLPVKSFLVTRFSSHGVLATVKGKVVHYGERVSELINLIVCLPVGSN